MGLARRRKKEFSDSEKLLHQASVAGSREAKLVRAFLLRKAVRRKKDAKSPDVEFSAEKEIQTLKGLSVDSICARFLRGLGLAHTGPHGLDQLDENPDVAAAADEALQHKRMRALLDEFEERVTHARRVQLAQMEGRDPPQSPRTTRKLESKRKKKRVAVLRIGQGAAFVVSLSGQQPDEGFLDVVADEAAEGEPFASTSKPKKRKKEEPGKNYKASVPNRKTSGKVSARRSAHHSRENSAPRSAPESGGIHGSWAAKKALKQKESITFSGKKKTFGDSDEDD